MWTDPDDWIFMSCRVKEGEDEIKTADKSSAERIQPEVCQTQNSLA